MSKFKITFFIPCVLFTVVLAAFVVTGCNGTTTIEDYVETGGAAAYDPAQPVQKFRTLRPHKAVWDNS